MKRCVLISLCGLSMAWACSVPGSVDHEERNLADPVAEIGQAIDCTMATASANITVPPQSSNGVFSAGGTCTWSGGDVNGARLSYYIDDVLVGFGEYSCSQPWSFSMSVATCAAHAFKVIATPMKFGAAGTEVCVAPGHVQAANFVELSCDKCYIGGVWFNNGAVRPGAGNECQKCDTALSQTSWSFNPNGYYSKTGYCKSLLNGSKICSPTSAHAGEACLEHEHCWGACSELE